MYEVLSGSVPRDAGMPLIAGFAAGCDADRHRAAGEEIDVQRPRQRVDQPEQEDVLRHAAHTREHHHAHTQQTCSGGFSAAQCTAIMTGRLTCNATP
jgi:hypothetical protein